MHIAILGLGYVGLTTAACLTRDGHHILGVDTNQAKLDAVRNGRSPIVEPGVPELLRNAVDNGQLTTGHGIADAVNDLDMALVCVGTPSRADGKLDLSYLLEVTRQLGQAVRERSADKEPLLLVYRSTMPAGTMEKLVMPTLAAASGEAPGRRYEVATNPEFLREGTAIKDFDNPPKTVIGERAPGSARRLLGIYDHLDAPLFEVPFAVAEFAKVTDNCFHALKVAFGNEIGRIALARGVDPQAVMDIFLADTKLNISPAYLRPGGPFGGSCLPKDLSAMLALASDLGLPVPVLSGTRDSNAVHLAWINARIQATIAPPGPILMLGLAFKANTDDLRNSPWLDLADKLLDEGYTLRILDPDLDPDRLLGRNFALAMEHRRVIAEALTRDEDAAIAAARLVVKAKPIPAIEARLRPGVPVLDLNKLKPTETPRRPALINAA